MIFAHRQAPAHMWRAHSIERSQWRLPTGEVNLICAPPQSEVDELSDYLHRFRLQNVKKAQLVCQVYLVLVEP